MRRQSNHFLLVLGLGLSAAVEAIGQSPAFTAIDYPGATGTQAWGINPRGDIVGVYTLADKSTRGFVLRDGAYTSIDYLGSAVTLGNAINPQGDVVGEYGLTLTSPHHGFLLSSGSYTAVDFPGAVSTSTTGINSSGEISGFYTTANNVTHAFVFTGGRFTTIDYPGATTSLANGINSTGDVVASYTAAGVSHAYIWSNGHFTSFDHPAAAGFTNATGNNPRGDIVGRYRDAGAVSHGYLLSDGKFTTIDIPGATFTGLTGITPGGDVVGRQTTAGVNHGFLLKKQTAHYVITDMGPMGPAGQPFFISDSGLVSGGAGVTDGSEHAFLWHKGVRADLGTLGIGNSNSWAYVVNEKRQVVGQSDIWNKDPYNEDFCGFKALGLPTWGNRCLPFLWESGMMTPLPTLGNNGVASWINTRGDVAGWSETTAVDPGCPSPQRFQFKPVIWLSGKIQELPTIGGDLNGTAISINDSGQAVGGSGYCTTFSPQLLTYLQPLHAILWQNGKATDLGNLGGTGRAFGGNLALAINQQGQVVGNSDLRGDTANHAFLWTKERGIQDLGTLPGDLNSAGISINDNGEVVGVSLDAAFNLRAYHWQNGKMEDLNTLVAGDSSLYLLLASSINGAGEITGLAFDAVSNELHGFVATPSSEAIGEHVSQAATRPAVLADDHRRLIQQRLSTWRTGTWLTAPR